ncbi:MAG: hypothetical protein MJ148_00485 [Clostridia bacterium]|nr:hypothetical protein [Clostridia bacterium]
MLLSKDKLSEEELEKAKREEEERKEKEKERKAALNYFTAAYIDIVEAAKEKKSIDRIAKFFDSLQLEITGKLKSIKGIFDDMIAVRDNVIKRKAAFFKLDPNSEFGKKVKKELAELKLTEDHFATLSFCASGKDFKTVADAIGGRYKGNPKTKQKDTAKLEDIRGNCVKKAHLALEAYMDGKSEAVAKMLGEGLKKSCEMFAAEKREDRAIEWATYVSEVLYVLDTNPELVKKCGLNTKQISVARNVAELGNEIVHGKAAVDLMIDMSQKGTALSDEETQSVIGVVFKMKNAIAIKQELVKKWDEPMLQKDGPILQKNEPVLQKKGPHL